MCARLASHSGNNGLKVGGAIPYLTTHIAMARHLRSSLLFQALQHGVGECERDVDRSSQEWEGKEEVKASE